jgi:hypothetical protein
MHYQNYKPFQRKAKFKDFNRWKGSAYCRIISSISRVLISLLHHENFLNTTKRALVHALVQHQNNQSSPKDHVTFTGFHLWQFCNMHFTLLCFISRSLCYFNYTFNNPVCFQLCTRFYICMFVLWVLLFEFYQQISLDVKLINNHTRYVF